MRAAKFVLVLLMLIGCLCTPVCADTSLSTTIITPDNGAGLVLASQTISGIASSVNGVASVEVSTDGGVTWQTAAGTDSWSYVWNPPAVGTYEIVSRATDSLGGVETVGPGIVATITGNQPLCVSSPSSLARIAGLASPKILNTSAPAFTRNIFDWGLNTNGQLGNNTTTTITSPAKLTSANGFSLVKGGGTHTLALKPDGTVWAWGNNANGQLGDATTTQRLTPVQVGTAVVAFTSISAISSGTSHSLALKSDGTVWAWGLNTNGQLGDTTTVQKTSPVQVGAAVSGFTGIIAIAAGGTHSLALKNDGTVWAWGNNANGQLGIGSTTQQTSPIQITTLSSVASIAAGGTHSLALTSGGLVYTWGNNTSGQLGNGTTTQQTTPFNITGFTSTITNLVGGGNHSVALANDGSVYAWGANASGQLGDGTTTTRLSPVAVTSMCGATAIAAGLSHTIALRGDGNVWGWGANANSQLGDGTATAKYVPTKALTVNKVGAIAVGDNFSLSIRQTVTSIIDSPVASAVLTGDSVSISGRADDGADGGVKTVECSQDNGSTWTVANGTATWTCLWNLPVNGTYNLKSRATDNAGLQEILSTATTVAVTNTLPVSSYVTPTNGGNVLGVSTSISGTTVAGSATVSKVSVSTDGGTTWADATGTTSWSYNWTLPINGTYTLRVKATDKPGNVETIKTVSVNVVNVPPTANITTPATQWTTLTGSSLVIKGTAAPGPVLPLAKVEVSTDGGVTWVAATGTTSWTYSWTLPANGSYSIYARATDSVGNIGLSKCIPVIINNLPPSSTITSPATGSTIVGTATVTGTAKAGSASLDHVEISTNGGTTWTTVTGTTSWTYTLPGLANGSYTIVARAVDTGGNVDVNMPFVTVTVSNPVVRPVSVVVGSAAARINSTVTVPVTISNPDNAPVSAIVLTIAYDATKLLTPTVKIADAATTAGKSLAFNIPVAGQLKVTISNLTQSIIGSGTLAYLTFKVAPVAPGGATVALTSTITAANTKGAAYTVSITSGSITPFLPGDTNLDGTVTAAELQAAVDMLLGLTPVSAYVDTDNSGSVTSTDIQAVVNSSILKLSAIKVIKASAATLKAATPVVASVQTVTYRPTVKVGSAKGGRGQEVVIPVTMARAGTGQVTALSSTIHYDPLVFGVPTVTAGPAAQLSGKEVAFNVPENGKLIFVAFGVNASGISNGEVAYIKFPVLESAKLGSSKITQVSQLSDGNATAVKFTKLNGYISVK